MPLIKPEIQKALRSANLMPQAQDESDKNPELSPFEQKLENAGLGLEDTLLELANLSKNAINEHLRLRSIEDVLKLHQVLKDQPTAIPQISIIINDPSSNKSATVEGANPIFLPRELIATLSSKISESVKNQGGIDNAISEDETRFDETRQDWKN